MYSGKIARKDGTKYKAAGYFVKGFKSFWHWYMLIKKKEGIEIFDITTYLDTKVDKAKWVYLSEETVKRLCDNAKYEYKVLMMFLFSVIPQGLALGIKL